jgi:hypothetical protein
MLTIDETACSFEAFPPTISPKPTMAPTSYPTMIIPTKPPTLAPVVPTASSGGGTDGNPATTDKTSAPSPAPTTTPETMAEFVATTDQTNPEDTSQHYIVRITDPDTIDVARQEVQKLSGFLQVSGTINIEQVPWNPNWTFYVRPNTVRLGSIFSESCDVTVKYIQFNVNDAGETFLPDLQWCPSNSRLLRELEPSSSGGSGGDGSTSDGDGDSTPNDSPGSDPSSDGSGEDEDAASSAGGVVSLGRALPMTLTSLLLAAIIR